MDYPLAPVEKILKKSNMRVSKDAVPEFALLLEEITVDIASEAAAIAKSRGKRTISADDVRMARRNLE